MKKRKDFLYSILLYIALGVFMVSCATKPEDGDLAGVQKSRWYSEKPYGMTLIPQGDFELGKSSESAVDLADSPIKTVSVTSFYMDETEITNSEYRQYVYWVRDSIVRTRLALLSEELEKTPKDKKGIGRYAFKDIDTVKFSEYQKYLFENYPDNFKKYLNWDEPLIWDTSKYIDGDYSMVMDSIYLPVAESVNDIRIIDVEKLNYKYTWFDIDKAASEAGSKRNKHIKEEVVNVYPDTLVWMKDFHYSYNEPMHNQYFHHSAYAEYPVVGVTWDQARAFCAWRTMYKNNVRKTYGQSLVNNFRLPTEQEWEYAARGGIKSAKYPWGGPYTLDDRGCYLANFKPLRGNYAVDNALYTSPAMTYAANGYNLYDMAGNVSEWTSSVYFASTYNFISDINPNTGGTDYRKKVIRGGSWKDVAYFLEVSTRDYEFVDSARSYIGFRTIQDYLGQLEIADPTVAP